ncbi:hypothetical protein AMECASPLE_005936, partial [Ameca splendens]
SLLCAFLSCSSWGCCHKSTHSSCTSSSSWTSMCSAATLAQVSCQRCTASCAALSLSLCSMVSAMELS